MVIKSINYNYNEDAGETAGTMERRMGSMIVKRYKYQSQQILYGI